MDTRGTRVTVAMLLLLTLALISTIWPSGLLRCLQAPVRKGVGSNPTTVILGAHVHVMLCEVKYCLRVRQTFSAQITPQLASATSAWRSFISSKGVVTEVIIIKPSHTIPMNALIADCKQLSRCGFSWVKSKWLACNITVHKLCT